MAAKDIATIRTYIQDRLNTLADPLVAYDVLLENVRLPNVVIVYPAPPPDGQLWLSVPTGTIRYRFTLEVWIDTQQGLERAQNALDGYISPTGTNANSIEGCLEARSADNLTTYTTSVRVDAFSRYGFGELHGHEGLLYATIPVECLLDGT